MKIDFNSRGHFKQRVDEYLHQDELHGFTYTELANAIKKPIATDTLLSGETYKEVELNGVEFGLGYVIDGEVTYIKTVISPLDVETARTRHFKCKREVA